MTDYIAKMNEVFPKFATAFIDTCRKEDEITDSDAKRLMDMLNYNCVGGKVFRGIQVRNSA
jgi:hypothetical protein